MSPFRAPAPVPAPGAGRRGPLAPCSTRRCSGRDQRVEGQRPGSGWHLAPWQRAEGHCPGPAWACVWGKIGTAARWAAIEPAGSRALLTSPPAVSNGRMASVERETLSQDELRKRLYQTFKNRGVLDTLKVCFVFSRCYLWLFALLNTESSDRPNKGFSGFLQM